jgi:hypothetical protein
MIHFYLNLSLTQSIFIFLAHYSNFIVFFCFLLTSRSTNQWTALRIHHELNTILHRDQRRSVLLPSLDLSSRPTITDYHLQPGNCTNDCHLSQIVPCITLEHQDPSPKRHFGCSSNSKFEGQQPNPFSHPTHYFTSSSSHRTSDFIFRYIVIPGFSHLKFDIRIGGSRFRRSFGDFQAISRQQYTPYSRAQLRTLPCRSAFDWCFVARCAFTYVRVVDEPKTERSKNPSQSSPGSDSD